MFVAVRASTQVGRTTVNRIAPPVLWRRTITQLTDDERVRDLEPLFSRGWEKALPRDAIKKEFQFKDFSEAWGFMSRAALIAESMNHHPVSHISYFMN